MQFAFIVNPNKGKTMKEPELNTEQLNSIKNSTEFENRYITTTELMKLLNLPRSTLYFYIKEAIIPAPKKIGRSNRWLLSEITEWMKNPTPQQNLKTLHFKGLV